MKLLFIGDIVREYGCNYIKKVLFKIKKEYEIDITVANGENSAVGNGINKASMDLLYSCGVDVITTGNHAFYKRDSVNIFDESEFLLRPANYPQGVVGKGVVIFETKMIQVAIINLMGTVYMDNLENPFNKIDGILSTISTKNIIVDFHAEATSEKKAMGHYLAGKVTAVFGTHTHVQTSDAVILKEHTGYITDAGMTGAEMSVLGIKKEVVIEKFKTNFPVPFEASEEPCFLNGVVIDFDERTGKCKEITPIIYRG